MRITRSMVLVLIVALVATVGTGCRRRETTAPQPEPTATTEPTTTPPDLAAASAVRVYFTRGEQIGVAGREVTPSSRPDVMALRAVQALLEGPTSEEVEFGLTSTIPTGTEVNGVEFEGRTAIIDLNSTFESGGGSLSMLLRVAQVVCTLTQFSDIDTVAFELDGRPVQTIGGEGIIVDPPVGRDDFEGQMPAILVETPVPGQEVTSPLSVSGTSNVFEATHQLQVTDPDGLILVDKFVTATSGTGTRGTWTEQVEFGPVVRDGFGAVIVFEYSPKDGSQQNVVEIPVRMTR